MSLREWSDQDEQHEITDDSIIVMMDNEADHENSNESELIG
jgi:hypothetical protein